MTRRWIFFDAVGTLFHVRGSVGGQYARAARKFGAGAIPEKIDAAFHHRFSLASSFTEGAPGDSVREREFNGWKDLVRRVFEDAEVRVDFDRCFDHIFKAFSTAVCWDLYPETLAVLRLLKEGRYSAGIISNFDSRLLPLLEDLGLRRWIREVILSSSIRAAKPDSRIFLEACVRAGTRPELAWHVGDSLAEDYQGARRAGLRAVLLDRDRRYPRFPGARVERLSRIFSLLEF